MEAFSTWIIAGGVVGTLVGAVLVYRTLVSNHDWKRREYAMNIIGDWNNNTTEHWQIIEPVFPHLRDVDRTSGEITELTKQQAKDIYTCEPSNNKYWELRYHIVEMLNYLEYVGMSYSQNVADQYIIESCLKEAMIKYYDIFKNLIEVVEICEGYSPWEPYTKLVESWKMKASPSRRKTA